MKHLFIVNPVSFRFKRGLMDCVLAEIHGFFSTYAPDDYEIHISRFPRDALGYITSLGRVLPKDELVRVYAVGGDGILFDCLNGVAKFSNMELAAIPYGKTNCFVRFFGRKNMELFRNIPRQVASSCIPVDVISAGCNYALNFCSIGVDAEAARKALHIREAMERGGSLTKWLSGVLYKLIFLIGAVVAFFNKALMFQHYDVFIDGVLLSGAFRTVTTFNGSFYGGNMQPLPNATPDDGKLDMILLPSRGIIRTLLQLPFFISGRCVVFPDFIYRQALRIDVHSEIPLHINLDGEVFFDNDFSLELLPGAVRFVDASNVDYRGKTND